MNTLRGLRSIFFVTSIFIFFTGIAQSSIESSKLDGFIPFQVFRTQNERIGIKEILNDTIRFGPPSDFKDQTSPNDIFWIRLDVNQNTSFLKENNWFLTHTNFDHAQLYHRGNQNISEKSIGKFDFDTVAQQLKSAKYFSETEVDSSFIFDGHFMFIKAKRVIYQENINNWKFGYTKDSIKDIFSWNDVSQTVYSYIFSGIAGLMTIIMLVFFGYFKRWEFLMYSLYTFFMFVYAIKDEFVLLHSFLPNHPLLKIWLFEDLTFLIGIVYLGFTIYYLNLRKEHRLFCKIVVFSILLHVIFFMVDMVFYLLQDYTAHILLMKALPLWDSLFSILIAIYILVMSKKTVNYLYIIGLAAFMIGTGIHFYLKGDADPMGYYNKLPLYIGSTIEIIIFAFGLIYKLFMEHMERLNFEKEAYINKNKALRAQLNPHFIFNALGSIQHLILNKKNDSALNYLNKFSRMARNALEASMDDNGTLEEEISMLEDYLELESLRFDNAFTYSIQTQGQVDVAETEIPFMVSQPFVENSLIHGLLPKESGKKELNITFKEEDGVLACIIDDSGVGRIDSSSKKSIYQNKRKSRGMEIAVSRLKNWKYGPGKVEIIDKYDTTNNPSGTEVIILIPIK